MSASVCLATMFPNWTIACAEAASAVRKSNLLDMLESRKGYRIVRVKHVKSFLSALHLRLMEAMLRLVDLCLIR
jgi:hypothetical protein